MKTESSDKDHAFVRSSDEKRPFRHQVAFVGPPNYFDASPSDFLRLARDGVGVTACRVTAEGASRDPAGAILHAVSDCAMAGADIVAVVGSNWSDVGLGSYDEMADFRARLETSCGVPVHLAPMCMVDALQEKGARRIALNTVYATPRWRGRLRGFFAASGFTVVSCGNLVDQGLVADTRSLERHAGFFPIGLARATMQAVRERAGDVDVIVVTGIPSFFDQATRDTKRMVHLLPQLEKDVGIPIVSTDTGLYRSVLAYLDDR
jgi:maleate cis-trans isomerase